MDAGTQLVQAYLHVNGYFTATDYPLVETRHDHAPRPLTDIDMLAVRFGREPHLTGRNDRLGGRRVRGPIAELVDPALQCPGDRTDMIVAEVKQGRAQVNAGASNRLALAAALSRFGCCDSDEASAMVERLVQKGTAQGNHGHVIRMVLFASSGERAPSGWLWIHLDHVFRFLDTQLRSQENTLGHIDLHDPALNWLALLHKCGISLSNEKTPA